MRLFVALLLCLTLLGLTSESVEASWAGVPTNIPKADIKAVGKVISYRGAEKQVSGIDAIYTENLIRVDYYLDEVENPEPLLRIWRMGGEVGFVDGTRMFSASFTGRLGEIGETVYVPATKEGDEYFFIEFAGFRPDTFKKVEPYAISDVGAYFILLIQLIVLYMYLEDPLSA